MKHVHFIGIGGAGISAIAKVLLDLGWRVSGSDQQLSDLARQLAGQGAVVHTGHAAENVNGAELVVISSAVTPEAPGYVEVQAARERGVPVLKRADFLGTLMEGKTGIAIAGAHGKTTTTGLTAFLLERAGLDPTFIVGGVLVDYGTNARAGQGAPFVIEADEYDRMFLGLQPAIAVITNVEHDHPDCYPTLGEMQEAFRQFANLLPEHGLLIACARDAFARKLALERRTAGRPALVYGLRAEDDFRAASVAPNNAGGSDFLVLKGEQTLGLARTRLPGEHNVLNSLAALAVADYVGVDFNAARNALAEYRGAGRRFEVKGEVRTITVIDDYAHHPTEIKATLAAARRRFVGHTLWVMFQPHTYSRTRTLLAEFAGAFTDADHVIIVDIFRSRETPDPTLSAKDIVRRMSHKDVRHIPTLAEAAEVLCAELKPGDILLTLGAGDGNWVGEEVLRRLNN